MKHEIWKYCWTHGARSDAEKNTNYKADGYKDEATFTNRKGGSELRLKKDDKE